MNTLVPTALLHQVLDALTDAAIDCAKPVSTECLIAAKEIRALLEKPLPGADWTITMRRMMNSGSDVQETWRKHGWTPPSDHIIPPPPEKEMLFHGR
jgi:hypothetical protein